MLPVFRNIAAGDSSTSDIRKHIANDLSLTEADLTERLPSGSQTIFGNRVAWAIVYLQRAGLIEKAAPGIYRITKSGQNVLSEKPFKIDLAYLQRFPSYVEWRRGSVAAVSPKDDVPASAAISPGVLDASATPEEQIARSYRTLRVTLEAELLDRVRDMSPAFFENLVIDVLIKLGYGGGQPEMGQAIGRSGDGGIDGVIKEDALGLDVVYVQAKRYGPGNSVGRSEVQAFAGSLDGVGATKGIFITTGSFSAGAREYVQRISKRIVLIDGVQFAGLMFDNEVGIRVSNTYKIKSVDENYFVEA